MPGQLDNPLAGSFIIYPNPTEGIFNISRSDAGLYQIAVMDVSGTKVLQVDNNYDRAIIDLSEFDNGIYIIQINTSGGIYNQLITKQ